jgi:hypothetical protein
VRLNVAHGSVSRTDVLERDLEQMAVSEDGTVELKLRPFELVTLRFASPA